MIQKIAKKYITRAIKVATCDLHCVWKFVISNKYFIMSGNQLLSYYWGTRIINQEFVNVCKLRILWQYKSSCDIPYLILNQVECSCKLVN